MHPAAPKPIWLGILAVLGSTLAAPSAFATDKIFKIGASRPLNVEVVSENVDKITYTIPGTRQQQELDASLVDQIIYDDTPDAFQKGLDFLASGDADNAISNFKLAMSGKAKWLPEYCNFYLGEAYSLAATRTPDHWKAAADAYEKSLSVKADSRFLTKALRGRGISLSRSGDADGAATCFEQLSSEAKSRKLGAIWEARAKILKAEAFEENGVPTKAKDAFKDAGTFAAANAAAIKDEAIKSELLAIAGRAQLSEGVALLEAKQYREARLAFGKIAQDAAAASTVIAGAQCGLGQVLLAEGDARKAMNQFARVRVLYFLEREQTARATYFLGKCCQALGNKEPNGARKARIYFTEVTEKYGDTIWANRAQAEL